MATLSIRVAAAGGARIITHELLTPAEVDEALETSVDYTPPGG